MPRLLLPVLRPLQGLPAGPSTELSRDVPKQRHTALLPARKSQKSYLCPRVSNNSKSGAERDEASSSTRSAFCQEASLSGKQGFMTGQRLLAESISFPGAASGLLTRELGFLKRGVIFFHWRLFSQRTTTQHWLLTTLTSNTQESSDFRQKTWTVMRVSVGKDKKQQPKTNWKTTGRIQLCLATDKGLGTCGQGPRGLRKDLD